jgi:hypothetical protein
MGWSVANHLIGLGYSKACQGRLLLEIAFFQMRHHPHLPPFDDFKFAGATRLAVHFYTLQTRI